MTLGPKAFYQGIEQLPPGHFLSVEPQRWDRPAVRYWQLKFDPDPNPDRNWVEIVREAVDDSVRAHLVADVPVGAFLSGGIDSASIVASAANQSSGRLRTFSVGFREEAFSELPAAQQLADRYGTEHYPIILLADALHWVDSQTDAFDEPLADVSAIPTLLVSQAACQQVKVVLSGDGGDEAFGGYPRYVHDLWEDRIRQRVPRWFRSRVLQPLGNLWPQIDRLPKPLRFRNTLQNLSQEAGQAYANTLKQCRLPLRHRLLRPEIVASLTGYSPKQPLLNAFHSAPDSDRLAGMTAADLAVIVPDDYLVKIDRASMRYGLEVRPPLLDHRLLELAATIPSAWKIRGNQTKWILKTAMKDRIPAEILNRPKQGFVMPIDNWLRANGPLADLYRETVLNPQSLVSRFIDPGVARKLLAQHQSGRSRNGRILWTLLVLGRWAERYLRAPVHQMA
jgi:asparagine synthase (glutamine-hydrolysing)